MVNGLSRQIVQSEKILKDNKLFMRLYVYDSMEDFITVVDMPVQKSRFMPEMDEVLDETEILEEIEPTAKEELENAL